MGYTHHEDKGNIMSEPFLAEIRMYGFNFAPRAWAFCDGQILPINQHQSLYALLGITYGGDGRTSFALPDLRGRVPIHSGSGDGLTQKSLGQRAGSEMVTLNQAKIPSHTHHVGAYSGEANSLLPGGNSFAEIEGVPAYGADTQTVAMNQNSITNTGGGQAHENMQPSIAINYCIALQGLFPSRY